MRVDPSHKIRISDNSLYDEVCIQCGATDGPGDRRLQKPCPEQEATQAEPMPADTSAALAAAREAQALAESATQGPWRAGQEGNPRVYGPDNNGEVTALITSFYQDRLFIAWCRVGVPALARHIEALAAANAELEARLAEADHLPNHPEDKAG